MTNQAQLRAAIEAAVAISRAMVEAVREAGDAGAPAGPLYAAFMTTGGSLEQFELIMGALVRAGCLRKSGQRYYAVPIEQMPRRIEP